MDERKLCPLAVVVGVGQDECAEVHCAWWHGGMCDVSRLTAQLCPGRLGERMSITPLTSPQRLREAHTASQQGGSPYVTVSVADDGIIRATCTACAIACAIGPCVAEGPTSPIALERLECPAHLRDAAARWACR